MNDADPHYKNNGSSTTAETQKQTTENNATIGIGTRRRSMKRSLSFSHEHQGCSSDQQQGPAESSALPQNAFTAMQTSSETNKNKSSQARNRPASSSLFFDIQTSNAASSRMGRQFSAPSLSSLATTKPTANASSLFKQPTQQKLFSDQTQTGEEESPRSHSSSSSSSTNSRASRRRSRRRVSASSEKSATSSSSSQQQLFTLEEEESQLLAPATQMFGASLSNFNDNNGSSSLSVSCFAAEKNKSTPEKKRIPASSSLFGAVMNNIKSDEQLQHQPQAATDQNTNGNSNFNSPPPKASTGASRTSAAAGSSGLFSPGGFQLLDLVKDAAGSPFHAHAIGSPGESTCASVASPVRDRTAWHECAIFPQQQHQTGEGSGVPNGRLFTSIGLVDWSLKTSLRVECSSSKNNDVGIDFSQADARIQQAALLDFVSNPSSRSDLEVPTFLSTEQAAIQWEAGLLYWQYPVQQNYIQPTTAAGQVATQTSAAGGAPLRGAKRRRSSRRLSSSLSSSGKENDNGDQPQKRTVLSKSSSSSNVFGLDFSSKMPPPEKQLQNKSINNGNNSSNIFAKWDPNTCETTSSFADRHKQEWQEAFTSLFKTWMQQVTRLHHLWVDQENDDNDDAIAQQVAETYFYACGESHVILFRVGRSRPGNENKNSAMQKNRPALVPEILISSSTSELREKLRTMGVKLQLLERWNGLSGEFHEDALRPAALAGKDDSAKKGVDTFSPTVKNELIALRRAQVSGLNVGADVEVSMQTKQHRASSLYQSPEWIPPISVSGVDDCGSFAEVYLNCLGQINHRQDPVPDVPLLLCRKLGPFLHSSMKKLRTRTRPSRRIPQDKTAGDAIENTLLTTTDVEGIVLPCATSSLICAAVGRILSADNLNNDNKTFEDDSSNCEEHIDQRLTVRARVHERKSPGLVVAGTIGSSNTACLNSREGFWRTNRGKSCGGLRELSVWRDSSNGSLGHRSTKLFGLQGR